MPDKTIFEQVSDIVDPVYLVGGSVRDELLGKVPTDYDFATPLVPEEVEAAVRRAGKRPSLIGKRFGTIGFRVDGVSIEVTTFREERYETGSRKPEVRYVDNITYDLSRRDFTINAMAQRLDGHIVDPFGGKDDLANRMIRAVGQSQLRFKEDPLRMVRAARFAAQLDFKLEDDTRKKMLNHADWILYVSKERWVQELDKLLISQAVAQGLNYVAETRLLNFMLPEVAIQVGWNQDSPYHALDLWSHTVKTVALTPAEINLRWAALLHDIGKPYVRTHNRRGYSNYVGHDLVGAEMVKKIGRYLNWPTARIDRVRHLVLHHLESDSPLREADGVATQA